MIKSPNMNKGAKALRYATPPPHPPQNHLHLAECTCRKSCLKICVVGRDVICGVLHAFQLRYFSTATAAPQNQLHLAECSCRKKVAWWAAM